MTLKIDLKGRLSFYQFSPKDIHRFSREMVMRINKMITKEKMLDLLSNSLMAKS